ncbi:MAG: hypothetical protein ACYC7A_22255 [Thermoanaerobaculia bacterium]
MDTISPRGPSHFTLSDASGSYVQAAGARLRLTIEYRKTDHVGFRHYVLGVADRPTTLNSVNSTAGIITVQTNEILAISSAKEVFRTFMQTGSIPERFLLRETTRIVSATE